MHEALGLIPGTCQSKKQQEKEKKGGLCSKLWGLEFFDIKKFFLSLLQ